MLSLHPEPAEDWFCLVLLQVKAGQYVRHDRLFGGRCGTQLQAQLEDTGVRGLGKRENDYIYVD